MDLASNGALTRDDMGMIEGVDENRAGLACMLGSGGQGLAEIRTREDHLGAVPLRCLDLRERGSRRHEHRRTSLVEGCRKCDTLRVVAGRNGHDPGGLLFGAQPSDAVVRTSDLERAGPLEVLAFDEDLAADDTRQRPGTVERRPDRHALEQLARRFDLVEADQRSLHRVMLPRPQRCAKCRSVVT